MVQRLIQIIVVTCATLLHANGQQTLQVPGQFATVQSAIQAATNGDTVLVAPGAYFEHINFIGKEILVRGVGGPNVTVLNGLNQPGSIVSIVSGEGPGAILDGFQVIGGTGTLQFLGAMGGGINIENSSPIISNCIVACNDATQGGFSTISNLGGGIRCYASTVGGATVTIRNCVIRNNVCGNGAGIGVDTANVVIERCQIVSNQSCEGFAGGGGIAFFGGTHLISDTRISNNLIFCNAGGGAVWAQGAHLTMANTIIAFNQSRFAPGIGVVTIGSFAASLAIDHCTIFGNTPTFPGSPTGGVGVGSGVPLSVRNSIVRANVPSQVSGTSASTSVTFSNIQGGYSGVGNIDLDPHFINPAGGDFHLDVTSPCIGAAVVPLTAAITNDYEGDPRPYDGAPDIGADEFAAALPPCADGTVGMAGGGPYDVVWMNGSTGGVPRRVDVSFGMPLVLSVTAPLTSTTPSRFILWLQLGVPSIFERYATVLGDLCFTPAIVDPQNPLLSTLANSFFSDPGAILNATPAPWTQAVIVPNVPLRVSVQGVIEESIGTYSITNGIVLNIVP